MGQDATFHLIASPVAMNDWTKWIQQSAHIGMYPFLPRATVKDLPRHESILRTRTKLETSDLMALAVDRWKTDKYIGAGASANNCECAHPKKLKATNQSEYVSCL